jgi:hypothetical protein
MLKIVCWLSCCFGDRLPFSKDISIQVSDNKGESEFVQPHILFQSRTKLVVEEKGVNQGFQINSKVQEEIREIHMNT